MDSESGLVRLSTHRGVATVTLDSPDNRNALSARLRSDLWRCVQSALGDDAVRVVVLSHTGPVFCAGADLKEARQSGGQEGSTDNFIAVLSALWSAEKPTVARLAGPARAGGLGLAAVCDFVLAADTTTFAFSEVRLGVVPAMISVPLRERVSPSALHRLFLTGEVFDAHHAVDIGLLTVAVPVETLDDEVGRLTEALRLGGPSALAATKRLLRPGGPTFADDLREMQALSQKYFSSPEGQEGLRSFAEKRPAAWVATP